MRSSGLPLTNSAAVKVTCHKAAMVDWPDFLCPRVQAVAVELGSKENVPALLTAWDQGCRRWTNKDGSTGFSVFFCLN